MIEWLWESLLLFVRIFTILSIINVVGAALGVVYAWWSQPAKRNRS